MISEQDNGTFGEYRVRDGKRPSISRRLTVVLVLTVLCTSVVLVSVLYLYTASAEKRELDHKADEYFAYFLAAFELPIWNFDTQTVQLIGRSAAQNELVVRLVVSSTQEGGDNRILFFHEEEGGEGLVARRGVVMHDGKPIGEIELGLTREQYSQSIANLLRVSAVTISVILVAIALVTGMLIRTYLKKPLDTLKTLVDSYSSGGQGRHIPQVPYREFEWFGEVLETQLQQLHAAQEKYRSIFENSLEGIFQTTTEGRIVSANPAAARILAYESSDELFDSITNVGQQLYVNPDDRQTFIRLLEEKGEVNQFQVQMKRKDGSPVWVEMTARAVEDEKGQFSVIEGVLSDISAEKQAAEERQRLEQQLQQSQRIEALGQLAGGIAHDFNNLLQAMSGHVQLLLLRQSEGDKEYTYLKKIDATMERASALIGRLLTFSRKMDIDFQPVSLNELVETTIQLMERTIPKMVDIESLLQDDLASIQADPVQMEQVLVNLITNAVDAMEGYGTLTIETENVTMDQEDSSRYVDLAPGQYIRLRVSDTGPGMDSATRQRIFEPFFTTKKIGEGSGLGLSTVYGIVKGHMGHIQCYSVTGSGTTFTIHLPVARVEHREPLSVEHQPESEVKGGNETILLVDDEEIIIEIAETLLQSVGYRIIKAVSGEEALGIYASRGDEIDLVIIDLNMPGMGGEKCVEELRVRDPEAKIIVASGYAVHKISKAPWSFGLAGFIAKPYRLDKMAVLVRQVLDR